MTLVLVGKGRVLWGCPSKIEVICGFQVYKPYMDPLVLMEEIRRSPVDMENITCFVRVS